MKNIILGVYAILIVLNFTRCSKSNQSPSTQSQILGNWVYSSSYRSDTVYNNGSLMNTLGEYLPKANLIPQRNYMIFNSDGSVYYAQTGWGRGMGGVFFGDTVQYTVKGSSIFLSYPSGVNIYSYPNFNYPAYQDTITITSLSSNTLTIKRKYHYKHLLLNPNDIDTKQSVDTLTR
ncbi:MAG: hypothetical protein ACXVMS_00595 [Flavisolibacter sp.]